MRIDDNTDAKRILLASPPADWRRQLGRPRITWLSTIQQDLKPYTPRSSRFGSEPPSVEDDVDVWRYTIVSYTPEMTTNVQPLPESEGRIGSVSRCRWCAATATFCWQCVCVVCAREKEGRLKSLCLLFYELGLYVGFL